MDVDQDNTDETSPDVRGFNFRPSNTSNKAAIIPDKEGPKFDRDSLYYDMSGDKYLIILNQHKFQKPNISRTLPTANTKNTKGYKDENQLQDFTFRYQQPTTRNGTDKDVKSLKSLFGGFDFKITVFTDLEYSDIIKNLTEVATRDHSKTSCVCVTVLTHGDRGGELHAADRPYLLSDIITIFEKQQSLVAKPKLFFIQACRGGHMDAGNTIQLDSESACVLTVPTHADFLVLYSTIEDYLSYRDANGSWMMQALCQVVSKHHGELDLLHMITLVNRKVAYERATYTPRNQAMMNKKQMPETRFTLTKLLKFR